MVSYKEASTGIMCIRSIYELFFHALVCMYDVTLGVFIALGESKFSLHRYITTTKWNSKIDQLTTSGEDE